MTMTKSDAAVLLGVPEREITAVHADAAVGPVIVTSDGVEYVVRDEPDADGKTGVMFLRAPSGMHDPDGNYTGTFPVYTSQPVETDDDEIVDAGEIDPLDGLTKAELVEWAAQQTPPIVVDEKASKGDIRAAIDAEIVLRGGA